MFPADLPIYRHLGHTQAERDWLDSLPSVVAEFQRRWQVRTGPPFMNGTAAWVAPGVTADGTDVVLKIVWPHREARFEAAGLAHWAGAGAVLVHAADEEHWALLLEQCRPGTPLVEAGLSEDDALLAAAEVLLRLWSRPPPLADTSPFESLADVAAEWADLVRRRMDEYRPAFDRRLVAIGAGLLETLPASPTRAVLLHGDFNPGNILRAERQPWLAIDAKPMVGDCGYDVAPLLWQVPPRPCEADDPAAVLARRYALFADAIGQPAERLMAWTVARSVESALWALTRDDAANAKEWMHEAVLLAGLAGL